MGKTCKNEIITLRYLLAWLNSVLIQLKEPSVGRRAQYERHQVYLEVKMHKFI